MLQPSFFKPGERQLLLTGQTAYMIIEVPTVAAPALEPSRMRVEDWRTSLWIESHLAKATHGDGGGGA
eukprot:6364677-Amphidinium_carterae.1